MPEAGDDSLRPVRVRTAPSPTGDPHVGTAYMSLFNLAFARQRGGTFVLRIEDTDRARYVEHSEQQILDALRWLGLDWDEGPDKGGPYGPYVQSQRLDIYRRYAEQLLEAGHAYYCWCSPERLNAMRADQQRRKTPTGYDRLCLGKTRAERARLPGFSEPPVIRMLIPNDPPLLFDDLIHGPTNTPRPDDQVILKADGFPTYHLAVVVDDHLMRISHVTRGEEWISSTPKQLLLYDWLGWPRPRFAHFPLLRNPDHSKISKRKNPAARLLWFREAGYLPEALVNFLALMGWSMPDGREIFSFDDLVANFSWDRFSPVGPVFDITKLDWLNGKYIEGLSDSELLSRARPFLPGEDEERGLRILAPELKTRVKRLSDVAEQVDYLFVGELDLDRDLLVKQAGNAEQAAEMLRAAQHVVRSVEPFEPEPLERAFDDERGRRGWKTRPFYMTVRVALTGKTATPPLFAVMAALGPERAEARLVDAEQLPRAG
jgi:glutamyl-tRNA synthetase